MYFSKAEYPKERYSRIGLLLKNAQAKDEKSILNLLDMFDQLFIKYCYLNGELNEDLKSEIILTFLKCVKSFKINEEYFLRLYYEYCKKSDAI